MNETPQDPRTGATPDQIEAAAERRYNFLMTGNPKTKHMTGTGKTWDIDAKRKQLIDSFTVHSRYLVPEGYVIARQQDVITPEIRQAVSGVVRDIDSYPTHGDEICDESDLAILRAIAEGGDR